MTLLIILIVLLFFIGAILTLGQASIMSFELDEEEEGKDTSKNKTIEKIEELKDSPELLHGAVDTGKVITLVLLSIQAIILTDTILETIEGSGQLSTTLYTLDVVLVVFLYLITSHLLPKGFGEKYSTQLAPLMVKPMLFIMALFKIPVVFITGLANFLLSATGTKTGFAFSRISEDKLRAMIDEGLKSGAINATEHEILDNVFEFNDLVAKDVMIPRTEMFAVEYNEDDPHVFREIFKTGHSLVPVYKDSLDTIIGIVHIKDLIRTYVENKQVSILAHMRPVYYVPESKLISDLLKQMQKRGERICIVTDEYGGTEGVVTIEDILSEIVGDISPENSEEEKEFSRLPDGKYSMLGSMTIDDFNETFTIELPSSDKYSTIAGFISYHTGKILNQGDSYTYENLTFELIKKVKQKMVTFRVFCLGDDTLKEREA